MVLKTNISPKRWNGFRWFRRTTKHNENNDFILAMIFTLIILSIIYILYLLNYTPKVFIYEQF